MLQSLPGSCGGFTTTAPSVSQFGRWVPIFAAAAALPAFAPYVPTASPSLPVQLYEGAIISSLYSAAAAEAEPASATGDRSEYGKRGTYGATTASTVSIAAVLLQYLP